MIDDLYSARILALAANMPRAGRLAAPQASVEKISRLCGSRVTVDLVVAEGRVTDFAQDVRACVLGQAAAAILGEQVVGARIAEIVEARDALKAMLKQGAAPPQGRFADLAVLAQVKDFPARHASTLLAFEATVEAAAQALETASETASQTVPARG
jgi:NifU-like protein involved in Fe-S cluster formation